jgi:hypothetical protein
MSTTNFPPTSRYHDIETRTLEAPGREPIIYLARRLCPPVEVFAVVGYYVVTEDERLDNVTARHLGDPEQFWRLCDANAALRPDELTERSGRALRLTLPPGIPGSEDA